jgi:DNA-binding transcriptional MerR regulator
MSDAHLMLHHEIEKIPERLFFRIGDVADILKVKPYVIRYWEAEFRDLAPHKNPSGQRLYRKKDVEKIIVIRHLLHKERYSIEGAKKRLKEMKKKGDLSLLPTDASSIQNKSTTPKKELLEKIKELKFLVKTPMSEFFTL